MRELDGAPVEILGGSGEPLHFSHANGYPPGSYRALLEPFFDDYRVIASLHRPLWQPAVEPESLHSWSVLGDDLIAALSPLQQPVFAIGHSMGASALVLAAAQRPELFRGLVLMEPVLLPQSFPFFLKLFGQAGAERVPLIRNTLKRTNRWQSPDEAFKHFRGKSVFRSIDDAVLRDYIEHGTRPHPDDGIELRFSREWEARCYQLVHDLWSSIRRLQTPVLGIRGARSDTLGSASWRRWQRSCSPQTRFIELAGAGHLLPFEHPRQLATTIQRWIDEQAA